MKKIPIGISDFRIIRTNQELLYVDKTELISEFLDDPSMVVLITRPRRFGKTLNLSTLRYFFDQENASENQKLFADLKVSQNKIAMAEQGSRPVIYLTFKDCKERSWDFLFSKIKEVLSQASLELANLIEPKINQIEWKKLLAIRRSEADEPLLSNALRVLSQSAFEQYNQSPLILIDEYDVPLQAAWTEGYYEEAIVFFRNFFSSGFKDNPYLWRGVITGCLRVARESMFTGMNNLLVSTVASKNYSSHFGLTVPEVDSLLKDYNLLPNKQKIEAWYNGYMFGETVVYNPWSILNMLKEGGEFQTYWANTSGNDLVKQILGRSGVDAKKDLEDLMAGGTITVPLQEQVVFQEIENSPANLWNFLFFTGYLKAVSQKFTDEHNLIELKIPNLEVKRVFHDSIRYWFEQKKSLSHLHSLKRSLQMGDTEEFTLILQKLTSDSLSYFDAVGDEPEKFYHGLVLGLIVSFSDTWHIRSNRESGFGRCDILMTPKDPAHFGIVMELKTHHPTLESDLSATAKRAMDQIEKRQYEQELISQGTTKILKMGIGFLGKRLEILSKISELN